MTNKFKTIDMVYIAVFAVLIAICSWISIPTTVPFTLQTFAVFLAVGVLGGKRGSLSVLIYILLGAVGIPVFAGFSGGFGVLLGQTGGYIVGFLFSALLMYIVPLFTLLIATLLSNYISENELIRAILIFILTALSFVMVKRYTRKLGQQTEFQPVLLRVLS